MNLHEYQAKELFRRHGIPIPSGREVADGVEAEAAARDLGGRVAVKAQVLVGGRGKAGGIRLTKDPAEARDVAAVLFGQPLKGLKVRRVLVEAAVDIAREFYLSLALDRAHGCLSLIASPQGGVDIEEVARTDPEAIHTWRLDLLTGVRPYHTVQVAGALGLPQTIWQSLGEVLAALYRLTQESDATLVEINPLVLTQAGRLLALDAKMTLDDSALSHHPDLSALRDLDAEDPAETSAREAGISYVRLGGQIGCMVNGAGLAMATMDVIKLYGGEPANFLDIGGGARAERVATAMRLILSDPNVRAVLINIFGGITRCDEVARGLVDALRQTGARIPLVVRLVGTHEAEGRAVLQAAGLETADNLAEAAQKAVAAAGRA